jgi:hypothetical protein
MRDKSQPKMAELKQSATLKKDEIEASEKTHTPHTAEEESKQPLQMMKQPNQSEVTHLNQISRQPKLAEVATGLKRGRPKKIQQEPS